MKNYSWLVFVFLGIILLVSCIQAEPDNSTETNVSFKYDFSQIKSKGTDPSMNLQPNEIIWIDITALSNTLNRKPLIEGVNTLTLSKSKNYLVGFVYNPNLDDGVPKLPYIKLIGGLEAKNAELNGAFPTTIETNSILELGTLKQGETGLESEITLPEISQMLGYDQQTLSSYGYYDDSLLKYLNPDINHNGLYDKEEEQLEWMLTPSRTYHLYPNDFNSLRPTLSIDSFQNEYFSIVFWFSLNIPHVDKSKTYLTLPVDKSYIDRNGVSVKGVFANHDVPKEHIYQQYYFNGINDEISSPRPPYDGDYQLRLDEDLYHFQDISFLSPWKNNFESFLFPQSTFVFNDQDILQTITYTWWTIRNGVYQRATKEELNLRVYQFFYYLPPTKGWVSLISDVDVFGTLDVSEKGIKKSELSYIAQSWPNAVRSCYWDTAQNEWSFVNHLQIDRP